MFFATISAEIFETVEQLPGSVIKYIKTSKVFLHHMLRQEVKKVLVK